MHRGSPQIAGASALRAWVDGFVGAYRFEDGWMKPHAVEVSGDYGIARRWKASAGRS